MRARHLAGSGNDSRRRAAQVATPGHKAILRTGCWQNWLDTIIWRFRSTTRGTRLQFPSSKPTTSICNDSDFTLTDVQERKWNLKSLRGKVVLVNFWATWCPPCRREIPDLDALYKRFRDQGLVILAITGEEASIVRPFISQQIVSYPVLLDPARKVKELFLVDGIPESFVYDREGRLVAQAIDRPAMQGFLNMLRQAGLQ